MAQSRQASERHTELEGQLSSDLTNYPTSRRLVGWGRMSGCSDSSMLLTLLCLAMAANTSAAPDVTEKDFAKLRILPMRTASGDNFKLFLALDTILSATADSSLVGTLSSTKI